MLERVVLPLMLVTAIAAPAASADPGSRFNEPLLSRGGAVSTVSPQAGRAAVAVLDAGGNAMDAAVTAVFAVGVTRPEYCGIGGGGFLVYRRADGRTDTLDFREQAPARYTYGSGVSLGPVSAFGTGHNVIGVPGTVAGMAAALERYGTIGLDRAIAPGERLAREGYAVTPQQAALLKEQQVRLRLYAETAAIYLKQGLFPYEAGDRLVQRDYADSLAAIAKDGPRAFYAGPIAKAIVDSMHGSPLLAGDAGTMTLQDLASYQAIWRPALSTTYRGAKVYTAPPPTSGGTALIEMLNLLEGFPVPGDPFSADRLHLVAEAQKLAWADRAKYLGDPRFSAVPFRTLASKPYAARRRSEISPTVARNYAAGTLAPERASHTTHVSVIDAAGNAVAVTCTIEQPAGSAVVAPGTGFLLNNELTDFDAPGQGSPANAPAPGKRPRSSITPVIVSRRGRPVLAVGAAGGPSIITGVLNTVVNVLDHHMGPAEAVDAPRADARAYCDGDGLQLCVEDTRIPTQAISELRRRGHVVKTLGEYDVSPEVEPVGVDPATGNRIAVSDPRGESGAAVQATGPSPRLRLRVHPSRVRRGKRVQMRFTVSDDRGVLVPGATVTFAGARTVTGPTGRATLRVRVAGRARSRQATASKSGCVSGRAKVTVMR